MFLAQPRLAPPLAGFLESHACPQAGGLSGRTVEWNHYGAIVVGVVMPTTLTLKNIPDDVYERLKVAAAMHRRSLNSEILIRLERSLQSVPVDPAAFLARLQALQRRVPLSPLTDELLEQARREGRP